MVECIVRISANLQSDLFPDSKCLAKRQIDPAKRGTRQRITAFVAEGSRGWDCVGRLVEPMIGIVAGKFRTPNDIRGTR